MISAKEAAQLSEQKSAAEHLAYIESCIVEAAKAKERKIELRNSPYYDWLYSTPTGVVAEVVAELRKSGYTVVTRCVTALVVKW
jgi:hypothetical protein